MESLDSIKKQSAEKLIYAAQRGHIQEVRKMLNDYGYDANATDENGITVLISVAGSIACTPEIIRELLAHGADINAISNNGFTALKVAAMWGKVKNVQELLFYGADVNARRNENDFTALMRAVETNQAEVVFHLINNGADCNIVNTAGHSALQLAIKNKNIVIEQMLIDAGARK